MLMTTIWAQRSPSLGLVNGRKGRRSQNGLFSMMMRLHVANGMCYTLYVVPRTIRLLRALLLPILHLERRDRSILAITIIVTNSSVDYPRQFVNPPLAEVFEEPPPYAHPERCVRPNEFRRPPYDAVRQMHPVYPCPPRPRCDFIDMHHNNDYAQPPFFPYYP